MILTVWHQRRGADASVRYDDYAGGQIAAEQCMEALDGKEDAQVIVFEEEPSIASSGRRVDGFTDWMKENYPNAERSSKSFHRQNN